MKGMRRLTLFAIGLLSLLCGGGLLDGGFAVAQEECAAARDHVRWVFQNTGATQAYASLRAAGKSPFESVLGAHDRNPAAQQSLLDCSSDVIAFLDSLVGRPADMAVDPNAPRDLPACLVVRWEDDFASASRRGPPPTWQVTANVVNNCRRPVQLALCVVFSTASGVRTDRQTHLLDRPILAGYTFEAFSSPTNEYSRTYGVCEIDETCAVACGQ